MVCLWDVDPGCCEATWSGASAELQAAAQTYATTVLWGLTGRRFGPCAVTVRPCAWMHERTYQTYGVWFDSGGDGGFMTPYLWDGVWRNLAVGGCGTCEPAQQVWLPGPVAGVSEVRVNNVVVPASAYRVDDGSWLVRQDGGVWPVAPEMDVPAASDGTFVVTYLRGELVPDGGARAAGELACEYIKACLGQPCRFPKRVTSVSRQGVSVSAQETVAAGETGLPTVDAWVRAFNPRKLVERARVFSPDVPVARVSTWG